MKMVKTDKRSFGCYLSLAQNEDCASFSMRLKT